MRIAARTKLGFCPLPLREAERIRRFLVFPDKQCCALDPCVGDGVAFAEIASDEKVLRYGVELDAGRAGQARTNGIDVIHGNCFDVQCPVESFSLIVFPDGHEELYTIMGCWAKEDAETPHQ
jgi:hypothetical protein